MHTKSTGPAIGIHYFIRAAILCGFSTFIVYLVKTDRIIYYIAPRMEGYTKAAAVGLYLIAVCQAYIGIRSLQGKKGTCVCDHPPSSSVTKSVLVYGMFALPLLLGFSLPNVAMSSALADKKGMNLSIGTTHATAPNIGNPSINGPSSATGPANAARTTSSANAGSDASVEDTDPSQQIGNFQSAVIVGANDRPDPRTGQMPVKQTANLAPASGGPVSDEQLKKMFAPPDEYSDDFSTMGMMLYKQHLIQVSPDIYTEVLTTMDIFKNNFIGKKIELSGFVYREDDLKPNQLVVGRFEVSCCTADASPFGVLVEFPGASSFAKDAWVKVTGTIEKGSYQDNEIFKIHAAKIENTAVPATPYVYPNAHPVTELKKELTMS